jgi:PAS domain S-box-containing protein
MATGDWGPLFRAAFKQSRNAMVLVAQNRSLLDVNGAFLQLTGYKRAAIVGNPVYSLVDGGPLMTSEQWAHELTRAQFDGEVGVICADGSVLSSHWGAHTAGPIGRRVVLLVMLPRSRWGARFRRTIPAEEDPAALSERELEIVRLVALGRSGPEIAEELGIAHDTVRTHVRNAMAKVGARSRAHLVAKALGEGHALR